MKEDNTYTINMVKNHIRTLNVIDENVLNTLKTIPRKMFVPKLYESFAHVDISIPIGFNQFMLMPSVEAKILQAMDIKKEDDVLVVGSGTGYLSTCISSLANRVHSVDIIKSFVDSSREVVDKISSRNMIFECQNILDNLSIIGNYKVIVVTMAMDDMNIILDNMCNNARSFVFFSEKNQPIQKGAIIRKTNKSSFLKEFILETHVESIIEERI
ncbi:MAG: hypothetical protein CMD73_00830 [Gammaproteobacteria bacterium]|jgi:protein-L-isoaspartate(D-aspartate) O-methyltransferase|nr:hypothetical protein [Gammaproteobacteria bacterium]|tara:strand:+ start:4951 stop:5592 length:642 start_codon:yes stop_codon:yes gene_type:complete